MSWARQGQKRRATTINTEPKKMEDMLDVFEHFIEKKCMGCPYIDSCKCKKSFSKKALEDFINKEM